MEFTSRLPSPRQHRWQTGMAPIGPWVASRRMEHHFTGPSYTIGIEEELMIVDGESFGLVNAVESLLEEAPEGEIKPELMESVLEISTAAAATVRRADEQLRALRDQVTRRAATRGLRIGS